MKLYVLFLLLWLAGLPSIAQLNVALLHQLIDNSRTENLHQVELRDRQALSAASEETNNKQQSWLKDTYRNNAKRFSALGLTITVVQIGMEALPLIGRISQDQQEVLSLCRHHPGLIPLAVETQVDLVEKSDKLLRYLYGISLSIGQINAMSRADRHILSTFVVDELRNISLLLSGLKLTLRNASVQFRSVNPGFFDVVRKDKALANKILLQIKQIK
jgi:hypothetical protein